MLTFLQKIEGPANMFLIYLIYCMLIVNILPISGNMGDEYVQYFIEAINSDVGSKILNRDGFISLYPLALYIVNNIGLKHICLFFMMLFIIFSCLDASSPLINFGIQLVCIIFIPSIVFIYRLNYPLDGDNIGEYKGKSIKSNIVLFFFTTVVLILFIIGIMSYRSITNVVPGTLNTYVISFLIMTCFLALYFRGEGINKIIINNIDRWKDGFPIIGNGVTDYSFTAIYLWVLIGLIVNIFYQMNKQDISIPTPLWLKYGLPSSSFNVDQRLPTSLIIIIITAIVLPLKKEYFQGIFVLLIYIHSYCSHSDYIKNKITNFHNDMTTKVRNFEAKNHPSVRNALK